MHPHKVEKRLGIYLDHAQADLVEYTNGTNESKLIESKFTHEQKEHDLNKSEKLMHNQQDHDQSEYYKAIADVIRNYDEVILFGPTEAKAELHNKLNADHLFSKIKIVVKSSDKLNETQIHTFVREYFAHH
jgi:stalled ribosome rescue protein Dom34